MIVPRGAAGCWCKGGRRELLLPVLFWVERVGREGKREERVSDETTETKRGVKVMFDEIRERER